MKVSVRVFAIGLVFATGGFSYAVATSSSVGIIASGASVRGLGTVIREPLAFTTPFLPGTSEYDLGDAALGSQIVRWVRARGGVPPHSFTSDSTSSNFMGTLPLATAIANLPGGLGGSSTAQLLLTGRLQGAIGVPGSLPNGLTSLPLQFDVTVTDSKGNTPDNKTGSFQVTLVNADVFKFAQTQLDDAVTYRAYFEKVEMIGGTHPYTFTVGQIMLTSPDGSSTTPITSLTDQMGLFFNTKTGEITGRPLQAGLLQIPLTCQDSNQVQAQSRDLSATGQTILINIIQNPRLGSEFFSTAITVKGNTAVGGTDSIQYTGIINVGDKVSTLNGDQVTFSIGQFTAPAVTLTNGKGTYGTKLRSSTGQPAQLTPFVSVKISPSNQIKIFVAGASFGEAGSILSSIGVAKAIVSVTIAISNSPFLCAEVLKFKVKAKQGATQFQMNYKFGPGNLGGGFLLAGVQGKDSQAGDGDSWKAGFVFIPPSDQKFNAIKSATVGIGTDFTGSVNVTNGNGKIGLGQKPVKNTPGIVGIGISSQGKGFVATSALPAASSSTDTATGIMTGAAAASQNKKHTRFAFLITLNDANGNEKFGGEGATTVYTTGTGWQTKGK